MLSEYGARRTLSFVGAQPSRHMQQRMVSNCTHTISVGLALPSLPPHSTARLGMRYEVPLYLACAAGLELPTFTFHVTATPTTDTCSLFNIWIGVAFINWLAAIRRRGIPRSPYPPLSF